MPNLNTIDRLSDIPRGCREIFLAGGCFWGAEEYLSRVRGVAATDVGYANGTTENPSYEEVCTGQTGYAETVRVVYNPHTLPLTRLLEIYFESIDPCAVNRQGHDAGEQYRTGIYYVDEADLPTAQAALDALAQAAPGPLAVQLLPLENYWAAEEYHQKYLKKNPNGYCHIPPRLFAFADEANEEA